MSKKCPCNKAPSQSMSNKKPSNESLQTAENDMNPPPAQDSPQNIVNILNDDCLQVVLLKLKKVSDFWSAAQVCTRFQANAKACFRFENVKFRYQIDCEKRDDDFSPMDNDTVPFESSEDFLSLFGPRIKSIHCDFVSRSKNIDEMDHEENLRLISQYCGQTLTELEIISLNHDSNLNLRSPYQALKKLALKRVSFFNFNAALLFPELQSLEMSSIHIPVEWFGNHFPMLEHVKIQYVNDLTNDIFIEFQNRNPQLQSLHCQECLRITSAVWENIGDRLPNIVELSLDRGGSNIPYLSALRQLKKLNLTENLHHIRSESMSLFTALANNNQPIEELKIHGVNAELGRVLQRLTTIKVLHIKLTSGEIVGDLVKQLPELEYLRLHDFNQGIHLRKAKKIFQNCKKVKKIDIIHVLYLDGSTDFTEYDAIVAMATGRFKLNFEFIAGFEEEVTTEYVKMLYKHIKDKNNEWSQFTAVNPFS